MLKAIIVILKYLNFHTDSISEASTINSETSDIPRLSIDPNILNPTSPKSIRAQHILDILPILLRSIQVVSNYITERNISNNSELYQALNELKILIDGLQETYNTELTQQQRDIIQAVITAVDALAESHAPESLVEELRCATPSDLLTNTSSIDDENTNINRIENLNNSRVVRPRVLTLQEELDIAENFNNRDS
ncbi:hypothetical protein HK096_000014 [Nowakowskiella sp. JEL0078]|nr:hypothetical protein HK096_000014 [Nowakowskiella sp. JEL0078]